MHGLCLRVLPITLMILLLGINASVFAQDVKVGLYQNPPKLFLDEHNLPRGILIDLLNEVAAREHWSLLYVPCHWQECLDKLAEGSLDLLPDVAYTQARDKTLDFNQVPALYSWSLVYARPGTAISLITDLHDKRIAVLRGSVQAETFRRLQDSFGFQSQLVELESLDAVFEAVANEEADGGIGNNYFGQYNAQRYQLIETPVVFGSIQLFYASAQGQHNELLKAIDKYLAVWHRDSDSPYALILDKWQTRTELNALTPLIWKALAALLALLVFSIAMVLLLRWRVSVRTRELSSSLAALRATETQFRALFEQANDAIFILDALVVIDCNRRAEAMYQKSRAELIGSSPLLGESPENSGGLRPHPFLEEQVERALRGVAVNFQWRSRIGEQNTLDLDFSLSRVALAEHTYVQAIVRDITDVKAYQRQLEHIAHYDPLTGLPNRLLRTDRLNQAISRCHRLQQHVAVAFLDLDGFKAINDHHGHDVGDALLVQLAKRLQSALREGDTLARVGGDEFVALIVDLPQPRDCLPVIERLLETAQKPTHVAEQKSPHKLEANESDIHLQLSVSIGVAFYPEDGNEPDTLIRRADQAMYQAKQAGRNRYVFFDTAQDARIQAHHHQLARLATALANEEFVLFYQPKVNMAQKTVIGAEALIRWQHPDKGLLPPAAFLPALENQALSLEIGNWVIKTALRQMHAWQTQGLNLALSINIGADQLQSQGFAAHLADLLALFPQVAPAWLELEMLETSAVSDMSLVSKVMHTCHQLGIRFALDDFGTGYSSLSYLRRLPVHTLKIDQSFVRDMLDDPADLAIVKDIVGLARAFGREVIAEGVETRAHGEQLLALGCELAQGYGIARPMPAHQIPAWVARWNDQPFWEA